MCNICWALHTRHKASSFLDQNTLCFVFNIWNSGTAHSTWLKQALANTQSSYTTSVVKIAAPSDAASDFTPAEKKRVEEQPYCCWHHVDRSSAHCCHLHHSQSANQCQSSCDVQAYVLAGISGDLGRACLLRVLPARVAGCGFICMLTAALNLLIFSTLFSYKRLLLRSSN